MKKIRISYNEFEKMTNDLAIKILKSGFSPDYIVGINRGGLPIAVALSHILEVPMYTLKVTLRDGDEDDCDHNLWMAEDAVGYGSMGCLEDEKSKILIIDDINDTGATYKWIKQDWQSSCLPNLSDWQKVWGDNIKFAVLVNNLASNEIADYSSMEINKAEDPSWIVFPWERE